MTNTKSELIEVCEKLRSICTNDEYAYQASKEQLMKLSYWLQTYPYKDLDEVEQIIELHRSLGLLKNRKASYVENEIGRHVLERMPSAVRLRDEEIPEGVVEELKSDVPSDARTALKASAALFKYGKEIVERPKDKSKRYKNQVKEALRMLSNLQDFYEIEGIRDIFYSKIEDKDKNIQFFAACGLEIYYTYKSGEEMTEEEEQQLLKVIKSTRERDTAVTCCQILIKAGKMDEISAMMLIDS